MAQICSFDLSISRVMLMSSDLVPNCIWFLKLIVILFHSQQQEELGPVVPIVRQPRRRYGAVTIMESLFAMPVVFTISFIM